MKCQHMENERKLQCAQYMLTLRKIKFGEQKCYMMSSRLFFINYFAYILNNLRINPLIILF